MELDRYFGYRSILECVHHYDINNGKNYSYYRDTRSERWTVLPWDVDLTWKNTMFGNGQEPFAQVGLLHRTMFQIAYQNRLREIRDLLFNLEATGTLIDQYAAVISDPGGGLSFVAADRAKWDYHPIMVSPHVDPSRAGQGLFYIESPTRDFPGMVRVMKDYVRTRGAWVDATLLNTSELPSTPTLRATGPLDFRADTLPFLATLPTSANPTLALDWRLGEITPGPVTKPPAPRRYEIETLWHEENKRAANVPTRLLEPGRTYRVRARARDAAGRCGHWSAPITFTVPR